MMNLGMNRFKNELVLSSFNGRSLSINGFDINNVCDLSIVGSVSI